MFTSHRASPTQLAGDAYYLLSKAWDDALPAHIDDYNAVLDVHERIMALLEMVIPAQGNHGAAGFGDYITENRRILYTRKFLLEFIYIYFFQKSAAQSNFPVILKRL